MYEQPDVSAPETSESSTASDDTVLTGAEEEQNSETDAAAASDSDNTDGSDGDSEQAGEGDQNTPPETYADFKLPEGVELDAAAMDLATPLFKEMNLNQEQAQKFVDLQSELVKAGQQRQLEAFSQLKKEWVDTAKTDSEFGGEKFEENIGVAKKAIDAYGTPELKQLMEDYGIGNHPEVIRFALRVGRTLREDVPGSSTSPTSPAQDRVTQMYGK